MAMMRVYCLLWVLRKSDRQQTVFELTHWNVSKEREKRCWILEFPSIFQIFGVRVEADREEASLGIRIETK